MVLIALNNIYKIYNVGGEEVRALDGIDLEIKENEYLAIMGPSGSGKSTLMNMIGCLDTPSAGIYQFEGEMVQEMNDDQLASIRNRKIGFVFQTFNLLPKATAQNNVEIPLIYGNIRKSERINMAKSKPDDRDSIIRKFQKIHGGNFDYSQVDYINHTTKVTIICRQHGPFEQQPRLHLRGSTGCRQCIAERRK